MNDTVKLSKKAISIVKDLIQTGEYDNVSDLVDDGLSFLAEEKKKIAELRKAIEEGEKSGIAENFSFQKFKEEMGQKYGS